MKLLHTGDWHVGKTLRGRSRAEEHRDVLAEIAALAREHAVDFVLVAGDLFDTNAPTPESETLVYRALLDLRETGAQVAIISGNHDNPRRLGAVKPLLDIGGVHTAHEVRRPDEGGVLRLEAKDGAALHLGFLPFLSKRNIVKAAELMTKDADEHAGEYAERAEAVIRALTAKLDPGAAHVLLAHGMVHGGVMGGGERSAHTVFEYSIPSTAFPAGLHYVALGHLHRAQKIPGACPVWYSGSPLQLDFGETENPSSVNLIEASPGKPAEVVQVPLTAGRRLRRVEGSLQALEAMADEAREILPNAVEVRVKSRERTGKKKTERRIGRAHDELFAEYLESRDVDDPALVALFRELLDEAETS